MLAEAFQAGMCLVVGLGNEACNLRDTWCRNAEYAEYAAVHSYRPLREPKDPTTRYRPKLNPAYKLRQDDVGFDVLDAAGNLKARFCARERAWPNGTSARSTLIRPPPRLPPSPCPPAWPAPSA